jgi:hypothetical protein
MKSKKEFINEIYEKNFKFNNVEQAICQSNLLDTVSKDIYPDPKRFIIEILQNADDASFNYMKGDLNIRFNQFKNTLIISHKGHPFTQDDIKSICSAGNSTKIKSEKATGYKGIGFKSVFEHSNKVIIISDGYVFRFDKSYFTNERSWQPEWGSYQSYKDERERKNLSTDIKKPWQIIPIYTERHEIEDKYWNIAKEFEVNFIVHFNSNECFKSCINYLYEIESDYQYLLFLKSKELNFVLCESGSIMRIYSKKCLGETEHGRCIQILANNKPIENYFFMNFNVEITNYTEKYKDELENEDIPDKLRKSKHIDISFVMPYDNVGSQILKTIKTENRVLYAFLPTKVNYNFPFLINTNFLLDASRTQLREGPWNKMIFSILPQYIIEYQKYLFRYFRNSCTESFLFDLKFGYKGFEDEFNNNIIQHDVHDLFIYTKTDQIRRYTECYINDFYYNSNNIPYDCILKFFNDVYGINKAEKILKLYFKEERNIYFDKDHEVDKKDYHYMENIEKYYNKECYHITHQELLNYFQSSSFKDNFNDEAFYRLLDKIKDRNFIQKLSSVEVIPDKNYNFFKPNQFIIYQPTDDTSKNNIISQVTEQIYRSTNKDKKEIHPDVFNTFAENEALSLLEDIGVQRINYQRTLEHLLENIKDYYKLENKNNSVAIVKLVFSEWMKKNDSQDKRSIIDKFKKINYLLDVNGNFVLLPDLIINPFYNNDFTFKKYESNYVSEIYFDKNTKKEDWVKFFVELELWQKENYEKCFLMNIDKEHFDEIPYIMQEFKSTISNYKPSQMYVCPRLNYIFEEDPEKIKTFFNNNIVFITHETDQRMKKEKFLNYFEWFIVKYKKVMITKNLEIKPIESIYSYNILKDKPECLKNFLFQNIDFCATEIIDSYLSLVTPLKTSLEISNLRVILPNLVSFSKNIDNQNDLLSIKKFFQSFLLNLAIGETVSSKPSKAKKKQEKNNMEVNNITNYTGEFLNTSDVFLNSEKLYYFMDDHIKDLLEQKLKKMKLSELKIPETDDENEKRKFIEFAKKNGVRIYSIDNVEYETEERNENKELFARLEKLIPFIQLLCNKKGITVNAENKLKSIKFFSCPRIKIKTSYGDNVDYGISFYEKNGKNFRILFLNDEVYNSWKHPTILYYISKHLAVHFNCSDISQEIQNLFLNENAEDNKRFLDYIV